MTMKMVATAGHHISKKKIGQNWIQQEKIITSDGSGNDLFGFSTSMSNGYAIIGAYGDDVNGSNTGSVYLYSYSNKPRINIDDQFLNDNTASDPIPFTIISADSSIITISAISSNITIVSNNNINISQSYIL